MTRRDRRMSLAFWLPTISGSVPLPFGSDSLPGSPAHINFGTWTWNLQAAHAPQ